MWATPDESREEIVELYHRVWAHSDATIDGLAARRPRPRALVAGGPQRGHPAPHPRAHDRRDRPARRARRHRPELIDGTAGLRADNDNLGLVDAAGWESQCRRLEQAAVEAEAG